MSDYISQDILGLILKRLSVKTLMRCRYVCKSWKQLIASKCFILDHLALQKPRILVKHKKFDYNVFDPETLVVENFRGPDGVQIEENRVCLVNCLHGVICIYDYKNLLILWNPSMHQLLRIPMPPEFEESSPYSKVCGFWIDPSSHDFKIVIFCFKAKNVALFSSRRRGWTELPMGKIRKYSRNCGSPVVLIDGVAHFLALFLGPGLDLEIFGKYYGAIHYFDFLQEKIGTVELPDELEKKRVDRALCKWQDSLSVVQFQFCSVQYPRNYVDLWVMQSGLWSKMFRIQLPFGTNYFNCMLETCGGRVLVSTDREDLVLYDPKPRDGCLSEIRFYAFLRSDFMYTLKSYFAYDFVESLVFPDRNCISSD